MNSRCSIGWVIGWLSLAGLSPSLGKAETSDRPGVVRLTLPAEFQATVGLEMNVYFDNVVLAESLAPYRFETACDVGERRQNRWTLTARPADVGDHAFSIRVLDQEGKVVAEASSRLRVAPADAGAHQNIRLLIIGDSLTHATLYPNELARLLNRPGNPQWTMLGTHRPKAARPRVAHEGYGGWTWKRFVTYYDSDAGMGKSRRRSPFVYRTSAGAPRLDAARYIREECGGVPPDFVVIMLGINDCFRAPPEDNAAIDAVVDEMLKYADEFIGAWRRAAPDARIGICLTTPPNSRDEAFRANYGDRYQRWGWRRIQHRLVERQLEHFQQGSDGHLSVIATEMNLDTVGGYPGNNAVHPNAAGYRQIAAAIFGWLKVRLDESASDR